MNVGATIVMVALLLCSGCTLGPPLSEFAPAREASGIRAKVATRSPIDAEKTLQGELLTISDDGVMMRVDGIAGGPLLLVPYDTIRSVIAEQRGRMSVAIFSVAERRERLRRYELLTRYPQGVSPELLQSLLAAYGQASLHRVGSPP